MRARASLLAPAMLLPILGGCVTPERPAREARAPETIPVPPSPAIRVTQAPGRRAFALEGAIMQGGAVVGTAPDGAMRVSLDGQDVPLAEDGRFLIAFDRDAAPTALLVAYLADGSRIERPLTIAPRAWKIEHVNASRRAGLASEQFLKLRAPELEQISAARGIRSASQGWRQRFIWPHRGRISGRFGAQRIYRGEAASYHSGVDVAGAEGQPIVAPADGAVVLATDRPFTLEGHLLILDHGMGLNSAFLHLSRIDVKVGDHVRKGQAIAAIGSSGRATGPHMHWGMKWNGARIDPMLLAGPLEE